LFTFRDLAFGDDLMISKVCMAVLLSIVSVVASGAAFGQKLDTNSLREMKWRLVGPFRGGRVEAVAGIAGDPKTYYFGAVAGGVWKTTDAGNTWKPVFDHETTQAIGAIGIAPSDPNIIYVGSGEPCLRNDITFGNGMYKSTDAGATWKHIGLEDTQHISKVVVDPRNPNIVLVAAVGHASGPNPERGIFKSEDGGTTWKKVLYKDDKSGAIDLVMDPSNSHILFAALYQIYRAPWILEAGGPGSGIYKSTDGGDTWVHIEKHGLPDGPLGRIGLAIAANSKRVFALVEAKKDGGMYRSDDDGTNWSLVNGQHDLSQRPWYFSHIFADPQNPDVVYSLAYRMLRSIDGGRTFAPIPGSHADHHALWIDPANGERMIEGNDGGATITVDNGGSWTAQDNQPTGQFYHVIADNRFMYYIYGAQQDNTSVAIASRTNHGAIDRTDWYPVGGGESGYIAPDPKDPNIVFAGGYAGAMTRFDRRTSETQMISPWPQFMDGLSASQVKHRFNWTSPTVFSPNDPTTLYNGGEVVFKTTNEGKSWTAISPDLTRNDDGKQGPSGGPVSHDDAGTEYYDVVFSIAESPVQKGLIWAGTDDGLIKLTQDGGKNWANVTPAGVPEWGRVDLIEASPHSPGVAYAAIDRHLMDDFRPYIFRTDNFGKTWTAITSGISSTAYVHAVREDPGRKGLLFAGTETGIYISFDDGANWQPLQLNLPTAPVYDLIVKNNDLVVATHGRSFWILDDIEPLRHIDEHVVSEDAYLWTPEAAYRIRSGGGGGGSGADAGTLVGSNPPGGAIIDYYLKSAPTDKIGLEILDGSGTVIRKFTGSPQAAANPEGRRRAESEATPLPVAAGLNRFVWDLRLDPPSGVPGAIYQEGSRLEGVFVTPGTYTVKLTVNGKDLQAPLQVKIDPDVTVSPEDLQKQFDLAKKISARVSQAHETVNSIRAIHTELQGLQTQLSDAPGAEDVRTAAKAVDQKMTAVEDALFQINKTAEKDSFNYGGRLNDMLIALQSAVERADAAPTQQTYDVFDYLDRELQQQLSQWNIVMTVDLPALNKLIRDKEVPFISAKPKASPGE
jgi:photosystem II stability/assembly factor-like uncharacterized protein